MDARNRNELQYPLSKVKAVIGKWLYLESMEVVDVIMACYVANKFDADPLWLIIIAPPSSAKTEILRSFDGHNGAYFISNLTPSTLASGLPAKKGKPEPSLLFKLNDKLVVLKDFTTVLSMRSENQQEILAQLRESFDGSYYKMFGNGKEVNWRGRFGLLAACTPIYDKHYGVIGTMGERFLLYRTDIGDAETVGLAAYKNVGRESQMRQEISEAVNRFISQFDDLSDYQFEQKEEDIYHQIILLSCWCALGRTPVERDYKGNIQYLPQPEGPGRLTKQLTQLGMALAFVSGETTITEKTYYTLKKVALDLLPAQRLKVIKYLYETKTFEHLNSWMLTKETADGINIPTNTVRRILEDLMVVGLLNRKRESDFETAAYQWQIGQRGYDLAVGSNLFT